MIFGSQLREEEEEQENRTYLNRIKQKNEETNNKIIKLIFNFSLTFLKTT